MAEEAVLANGHGLEAKRPPVTEEAVHNGHPGNLEDTDEAIANGESVTNRHLPRKDSAEATIAIPNGTTEQPNDTSQKRPPRPKSKRPNYAQIHAKPLPLNIHPLPAFHPSNPISLLRLCYVYVSQLLLRPSSHPPDRYVAYFHPGSRSIEVTNPVHVRALWDSGFFGKGSLSRSEPSWLEREKARRRRERLAAKANREGKGGNLAAEDWTNQRRDERRLFKLERARLERQKIERQKAVEEGRMTAEEASRLEAGDGEKVEAEDDAVAGADENDELPTEQHRPQMDGGVPRNEVQGKEQPNDTSSRDQDRRPDQHAIAGNHFAAETPAHQLHPTQDTKDSSPPPTLAKAEIEANEEDDVDEADANILNQEHLQLTPEEAFFLSYALGVLDIVCVASRDDSSPPMSPKAAPSSDQKPVSPLDLLKQFAKQATVSTTTTAPTSLEVPKIAVNNKHMHARAISHAIYTAPLVFDPTETSLKVPINAAPLFPSSPLPIRQLTTTPQLPDPDNPFVLRYAVYHHFRSLGWVVRPGVKFGVDYMLYNRGPVFSHAEFVVYIIPAYTDAYWRTPGGRAKRSGKREGMDWWQLHCVNRVQSQVKKTLVLVYVDVPPPVEGYVEVSGLLSRYKIREFVVRRWLVNRSRD